MKDAATEDEKETPAYQAALTLWHQYKDELPPTLVKQLEKASTLNRKAVPSKVDPEQAATAMKRLEQIFSEVDTPISRFN